MTHGQYLFILLQQLDNLIEYLEYCPEDKKMHLIDIIYRTRLEIKPLEELTQTELNREIKFIKITIQSSLNN